MSHVIGGCVLKARKLETAKKEGMKFAKMFALRNTDPLENPSGTYGNSLKYYDRTFNNEDEAYEFFDSLGAYRDGIVKIKGKTKRAKPKYFVKVEVHC